jgi:hypothetical protein
MIYGKKFQFSFSTALTDRTAICFEGSNFVLEVSFSTKLPLTISVFMIPFSLYFHAIRTAAMPLTYLLSTIHAQPRSYEGFIST